jgi:SPP1 gp7 family putative phage head morphogenesis protein
MNAGATIASFLEVGSSFNLEPTDAIEFFTAKGLKQSFSYADMLRDEHVNAFTVAKMMDVDLLKDVKNSLDVALSQGVPFKEWADNLMPTLEAKGWWGVKTMLDPLSGLPMEAQLGSAHRLETIFRTNLLSAYSVGKWQQIEAQAVDAPYLMYDAVDDYRTREQHAKWDGTVLPVTDKFWKTHFPPNGYNCRCSTIQLSDDDLKEFGLKVSRSPKIKTEPWQNPRTGKIEYIPEGIDPGFDYNPGVLRREKLKALAKEKIGAIEDVDLQAAAKKALVEVEDKARKAEIDAADYVLKNGKKHGVEIFEAFDADSGETIIRKMGTRSEVSFTDAEANKIIASKRSVIYHNHPGGNTLSKADLTFCKATASEKIVAVSSGASGGIYEASVLSKTYDDLLKAIAKADRFAESVIRPLIASGKLSIVNANAIHHHLVNSLLDATGSIRYTFTDLHNDGKNALTEIGTKTFTKWIEGFANENSI